ncbi:MAG: UDP-N-acetylglucosamine--N-acetylmuramyl-(pentapeptide) pyrophosphoryl-undecaprenol N-acetylglucosamine transferase [Oscillospiraceae bacterium]|jgi:UDP-N-acetylglucosamine--N-acetylmuramyl-(pentapeptide) pyrophosphoryl-undecaprenol N-acetylglucosamine transferase
MKYVLAAGGTAGHINPALAIAEEIKNRDGRAEIAFVGRSDGMESRLVPKAGYRLIPVVASGFTRGWSPRALAENAEAVRKALVSERQCREFYREFRPDFVIGCGGYVSGPAVLTAAQMKIRTAIQEQNAFPGVTTRLLAKHVDLIFAPSEDAKERIGYPDKTYVVGTPIEDGFFTADREQCRNELGVGDRTCILSFGGSNGSKTINELAVRIMAKTAGKGRTYHIHGMGIYWTEGFPKRLADYGIPGDCPDIDCRVYIEDMVRCMTAADLVIGRAGANTICEIAASGKASILIPSPNVTENHQYYNAMILGSLGAAIVCEEKDLDLDSLADRAVELINDPARIRAMGEKARAAAHRNCAGEICSRIYENAGVDPGASDV